MKLKFNSFLFVLTLGCTFSLHAQNDHFNCGQAEKTRELWAQYPELKADYEQLIANSRQVTTDGFTSKTTYVIPVVFHIIHQYGSENITDANVYDQMAVLNRDYRKLNADVNNAVAGFDTLAADANIQFKLAAIDPWGNCTNGIEHIYSHETLNGDDFSKLNQWLRSRYLNIWVVKTIGSGAAGYAYYPSDSEGIGFTRDGIMILNGYIGRLAPSSEYTSRALTHEIGHWLGLAHTWGSTNEPLVACGDDGITDTPITKGFKSCPQTLAAASICDPTIVENYQNYMDYSYCSIMFTKGQVSRMRNILQGEASNRNNLWKDTTLLLTGVSLPTVPLCAPVADFSPASKYICEGENVVFKDASWNATIESRLWTFQDGTPATSTAVSPSVSFTGNGFKKVTLTVTNASGSNTRVVDQSVHISQDWSSIVGPNYEDFNGGYPTGWIFDNPEDNFARWQHFPQSGKDNTKCLKLNNYKDVSNALQFSDDYYYYPRLGGNTDAIITPSYDLSHTTGSSFIFDYAYATSASTLADLKETVSVYSSTNCGKTWTHRKTLSKTELLTGGNATGLDFVPTNNSQWKTCTIAIPVANGKTRFKIEFNTSDVSNNMYIDNIRIDGVLGIADNPLNTMDLTVYPNPTNANEGISIDYVANDKAVEFQLMDIQGKLLTSETNNTVNSSVSHKLTLNTPLSAGCYYLKINQGEFNVTKKVVIL